MADLGDDLGDVGVDVGLGLGAGDGDAVVAVLDEVGVGDPVDADRGHRLAAAPGGRDPLEAAAGAAGGGAEATVELAAAVDRSDDRVERDRLQAEPALAAAAEGLDDLLEREDRDLRAGLALEAVGEPRERPPPPGAGEVELRVGLGEAGVLGH